MVNIKQMRNNCVQLTDTNISFRFADKSRESRWNILENAKAFCATHHRLLRTRQNVICPRAWTSFVQVSTKFWASFVSLFLIRFSMRIWSRQKRLIIKRSESVSSLTSERVQIAPWRLTVRGAQVRSTENAVRTCATKEYICGVLQ